MLFLPDYFAHDKVILGNFNFSSLFGPKKWPFLENGTETVFVHNFCYTNPNSDIDGSRESGQRQLMSNGLKTQHFNDYRFLNLKE